MAEKRVIRVTGYGQLKLPPDLTRLMIGLTGTEKEYAQALTRCEEKTRALREAVAPFGFAEEDLKTTEFRVDTRYESEQDKHGNWRQVFAGYQYTHRLKLEFPVDNDRLGKVLYAVAHADTVPEMSLQYTVADVEAAKNALIGKAVEDAREKAAILTQAADVALGEVLSINYAENGMRFETDTMFLREESAAFGAPRMKAASYDMAVQPDDITVRDSVTVVWEIVKA